MKPKGLRNITTLQSRGYRGHTRPNSRQQVADKLARLEHTRARLEREREHWRHNQLRTEAQLAQVHVQLAELHTLLDQQIAGSAAAPARQPVRTPRTARRDVPPPGWHEVTLEY